MLVNMGYTLGMDYKRSYTRDDLTHEDEDSQICSLCDNEVRDGEIAHDADCPLLDPDVMGVMLTALSKPRSEICEACPCGSGSEKKNCMAGDWRICVHETLLKCCHRYATEVR